MTQNNHLIPDTAVNEVLILRCIADGMFNMFDLSDHLAVRGRFVFSTPTNVTQPQQFIKLNSRVSPNPNKGLFIIDFDRLVSGEGRIFNALGVMIHQFSISKSMQHSIQLSELPSGIYFIDIRSLNNQKSVHRIIVY